MNIFGKELLFSYGYRKTCVFFVKKKKLHDQIVHPFVSLPKPWFTVGKYPNSPMMEVEIVIYLNRTLFDGRESTE